MCLISAQSFSSNLTQEDILQSWFPFCIYQLGNKTLPCFKSNNIFKKKEKFIHEYLSFRNVALIWMTWKCSQQLLSCWFLYLVSSFCAIWWVAYIWNLKASSDFDSFISSSPSARLGPENGPDICGHAGPPWLSIQHMEAHKIPQDRCSRFVDWKIKTKCSTLRLQE